MLDRYATLKQLCAISVTGAFLLLGAGIAGVLMRDGSRASAREISREVSQSDACAALLSRNGQGAFPDPTTRITSAVFRAAAPAAGPKPAHPAHCEVQGTIDDRISTVDEQHYAIKFHMRLPATGKWNGRFFMEGGGGYNGRLSEAYGPLEGKQTADALSLGFAVISTDSGHDNAANNRPDAGGTLSFGGDPQARSDFFYNSYGEVTLLGKALVQLYYGKAPTRSYFVGCSEGGREGLLTAQRFYDQYDGIIAGDPVARSIYWSFSSIRNAQVLTALAHKEGLADVKGAAPLNKTFSDLDIDVVAKAVLKACDKLDGLEDGMVSNGPACTTDKIYPELDAVTCKGSKTDSCLTADQIATLKTVESPVYNARGEEISTGNVFDPGMAGDSDKGINTAWHSTMLGAFDAPPNSPRGISQKLTSVEQVVPMVWQTPPHPVAASDSLKYILDYDYSQASPDPAKNYPASGIFTEAPGLYAAPDSPDLNGLKSRGGKLILFHGIGDPSVPYTETAKWYERMNARMAASGFARLFLVPGMNHCTGGPATDKFDLLTPLMNWVEKGVPPESIPAEASEPSYFHVAHRSRPLCPYPQWPHYKGKGDINEGSNFTCSQG